MGIMLSQNCGKIPVGDPHQQIYTFRGAVNALHAVPHTHIYYLTQSFRFGSEIAYIGAAILDSCKKVKQVLVGGNQDGGVRGEDTQTVQHLKLGQRLPEGSVAILSRCNVTVFSEAVRLTDVNPTILKMGGFRGLKGYAMASEDCEPEVVKCIYDHAQKSPVCADFILGTVHKAKGLEFDTVVVTDDFMKVPSARHILQRVGSFNAANVPDDEWNLLYVAITRAKRALYITKTISNILTFTGEYFLRSGLTSTLLSKNPSLVCSIESCENHITADAVFSMSKLPIRYLFELSF